MLRSVGKVAVRVSQEIRVRLQNAIPKQKAVTKVVSQTAVRKAVVKASRMPLSKNIFLRMFQRTIRSSRLFIRPFAALHYHRMAHFHDRDVNRFRFRGLYKIQKRRTAGVIERIRDLFNTNERYNRSLAESSYPESLDGYDIGKHIARGCSAAVYELRVKPSTSASLVSDAASTKELSSKDFPLAMKIMFNYDFDRPEHILMEEMGAELVPLSKRVSSKLLKGNMKNIKCLPSHHPNVIKMHVAFTDVMPVLPNAENLYPEALPYVTDYIPLNHEPRTLFIVMKRYRMTLREYMLTQKRNYWTARVMYGQLLEAIVYLHNNTISHRDLKSDNVLLDFDDENEVPHLVLSDFGTALATGSWLLNYSDSYVDLGGNLSLRAPEIRRAIPADDCLVDFSMADAWAAATLGYEIFTRVNPFYSRLSSADYDDDDLPQLPKRLHYAVKEVTYRLLRVDPTERPKPEIAANVVSISLFRFGQDVKAFLESCGISMDLKSDSLKGSFSKTLKQLGEKVEQTLDSVSMLYAAETILSRKLSPQVISHAELQLRATFLARLDREDVWPALEYFFDEDSYREHSNGSSSSSSIIGAPLHMNGGAAMSGLVVN